jgi:hypothetical protein
MSTEINVTVGGDGLRSQLKETVAQNRELRAQRVDDNKILPPLARFFAKQLGISDTQARRFIDNATSLDIEQARGAIAQGRPAYASVVVDQYTRRSSDAPTFYSKPETSAQKDIGGYPVAGFWIGQGDSFNDVRIRPPNFSATSEITFKKHNIVPSTGSQSATYAWSGDCSDGGFTSTVTWNNILGSSDDIFLWFPVGKDRCILAYVESGIEYSFSGTKNITQSWAVKTSTDQFGDDRYIQDQSSTFTSTAAAGTLQNWLNTKTWLITKTNIKEIQAPEPFTSKMLNFIYRYDQASAGLGVDPGTSSSETTSVVSAGSDAFLGLPCVDGFGGNPFADTNPFPTTTTTAYNVSESVVWQATEFGGFTGTRELSYTGLNGAYFASVSGFGTKQDYYGADKDVLTFFGSYTINLRGAGSFYVLNNPEISVSFGQAPSSIYTQYFSDVNLKPISLGANFVNTSETTIAYRFDIYQDFWYPNAGPTPTALFPNLASLIPFPSDPDSFAFRACWDWGLPAYCRQQLISLGFTDEDLSP